MFDCWSVHDCATLALANMGGPAYADTNNKWIAPTQAPDPIGVTRWREYRIANPGPSRRVVSADALPACTVVTYPTKPDGNVGDRNGAACEVVSIEAVSFHYDLPERRVVDAQDV